MKNRPFTRTEMKILVYNKVKSGMSYNEAIKQVAKDVEQCIHSQKVQEQELRKKDKLKSPKKKFDEGFEKLLK